jgi:hypothetical protein
MYELSKRELEDESAPLMIVGVKCQVATEILGMTLSQREPESQSL